MVKGGVEEAVARDLKGLGAKAARSGLGAAALELARQLDDGDNSATSKSMCAKSLQDVLGVLRALAPAKPEKDRLDELAAQRSRRRATA